MADPLCLPRTVEAYEKMRTYILQFINSYIGNTVDEKLAIRDAENDDGLGILDFDVYSFKTGKKMRVKGFVQACWDTDGKVFMDVFFDKQVEKTHNIVPFHIWL